MNTSDKLSLFWHGIPVSIYVRHHLDGKDEVVEVSSTEHCKDIGTSIFNGAAFTLEDLAKHDEAVARGAFKLAIETATKRLNECILRGNELRMRQTNLEDIHNIEYTLEGYVEARDSVRATLSDECKLFYLLYANHTGKK